LTTAWPPNAQELVTYSYISEAKVATMAVYGTGSEAFQWWDLVLPVTGNGTVTTGRFYCQWWGTVLSILGHTVSHGLRYCHYWAQLSILGYGTTILCNGIVNGELRSCHCRLWCSLWWVSVM